MGIIPGTQSALPNAFCLGYTNGVHAVSPAMPVEAVYVQDNSTAGFSHPGHAAEIAGRMYNNAPDVISTVAGYSNAVFI